MFDRFGEFDSAAEINETAVNLRREGDLESLRALAKENGIGEDILEVFLEGDLLYICDEMSAAIGKIEVEEKNVDCAEIMEDWVGYIKTQCSKDPQIARAVRKKGKSLAGCIAALLAWSFKHQHNIDQKILKAANVTAGRCTLGIPGMATAHQIIRDYYLGGGETMKKKAIEKVPFMGLQKTSRKKAVLFVGVTATVKIAGEEHLLLEMYRNRKEGKQVPVVRIALTKKDFGTYFTKTASWTRGRIRGTTWNNSDLIWYEHDERIVRTDGFMEAENILSTPKDLERIKDFCAVHPYTRQEWMDKRWWEYINDAQRRITAEEQSERSRRRYERRHQALKERMDNTPELPEQRILEYADRRLFHNRHYLYYKKHGVRATVACSACGWVSDSRWKPGISYESQLETMIEEPRMGGYGTCPQCGKMGKYMAQGRAKSDMKISAYLFLGQKYKETGMVFRYIEVYKGYQMNLICEDKGQELTGAGEQLECVEIARAYFEPGKKRQIDYHKHDGYSNVDFWDDCNLYGMANINIGAAVIMPETFQEMKGTLLQYSDMEEYQRQESEAINAVDYAERYLQIPQLEMIVKLKMTGVARSLVKCNAGIIQKEDARRPDEFLGIRKDEVKQLIRFKGDLDILEVMQLENRMGERWTQEQLEKMAEIGVDNGEELAAALQYMGVQKLLNTIAKYADCEYGTGCSTAIHRLRATAQEYFDYLAMRQRLGYDLRNTVYLFPRDLKIAHEKMVLEENKEKADARIREVLEKFPLIKKHYRRLRKKFYFEDEEFLIRPARDAGEIVIEGRVLHHCVGGDNYLEKHNSGKTTILFLRTVKAPGLPYITVEIGTEDLNVRQWYGAYDRKPDEDRMDKWIDVYVTKLKCGLIGVSEPAAVEAEQPVLAYA